MLPIVRCSFFRVALVALLLVALLQLLYLSLLSSLHRQQQWFMYPMSGNSAQAESRWQKQQMEDLKAAIAGSGVLDSSGQYWIYRKLLPHEKGDWKTLDVILASHTSINNLGHVRELVQHWDGRFSLALFASSPLQAKLATMLAYSLFRLCPNVRNKVTFHLVCKSGNRATFSELEDALEFASLNTCEAVFSKAESMGSHVINYAGNASYPNNLLRNVAKAGIGKDTFALVIDIDMVPSGGLRLGFINLAAKGLDPLTALPAFEIRHTRRLPSTKKELLQLYQVVRQAVPEVTYAVEWKDPWEPFYIGRSDVPAYDERFKQYGFSKIFCFVLFSQACELNMAGFSFAVLDSAFLLHKGYKLPGDFHRQKEAENRRNRQLFRAFKEELKLRYPQSPCHC
ncbi:hypothetical protein GDO86_008534 [Hymenochirus boettgeri]|uniref:Beta-1,4-glucuronyltransferase 1 n=1 Tax=Hymenochirus boettgeri TaxID=247094 RepID=A0A8T2J3C6_9PIPI|nr:hypothetical protein GDO86_008534 [Hymenochirus boettgeri]